MQDTCRLGVVYVFRCDPNGNFPFPHISRLQEYLAAKADDDAWLRPSPYLQRLDTILTAILESPCYSHLFTPEELAVARNFLPSSEGKGKLSSNARELYARLLGRRPCWFRVSKLLRGYGKERFVSPLRPYQ